MQLTAKNDSGEYRKRGDGVLKSELTATVIEKAREHFRAKAHETQQLQHAATEHARAMQLNNVFGSPDSALSDALLWARTNARQPQVAAWLEACNQWDAAIAAGEHRHQTKTTEAAQRPRHPMYEGGRYERKARCRDGVHPPGTH